ncbi:uncharacterized protein LOC124849431 [Scophthalmus maximus]|uniref:uncharacterized protein LOC124849431 n=1 Tax=Scophthalmus maximus TaxID=52904 RepID=UPI001FA8DFB2|nr:uncharacterized protein LOC124849431 [Scophthalmus maximus]
MESDGKKSEAQEEQSGGQKKKSSVRSCSQLCFTFIWDRPRIRTRVSDQEKDLEGDEQSGRTGCSQSQLTLGERRGAHPGQVANDIRRPTTSLSHITFTYTSSPMSARQRDTRFSMSIAEVLAKGQDGFYGNRPVIASTPLRDPVPLLSESPFPRVRHVISPDGGDGSARAHRTRARQRARWTARVALSDLRRARAPSSSYASLSSPPLPQTPFPGALCSRQKQMGSGGQAAAAVIDKRFIWRDGVGESDGVVYCRSPGPHICPVLLGSTPEQFSWEREICRCLFFFFSSPSLSHKQMHQAKPSQAGRRTAASDAQREKCFVRGPSCAFWERETCFLFSIFLGGVSPKQQTVALFFNNASCPLDVEAATQRDAPRPRSLLQLGSGGEWRNGLRRGAASVSRL